MVTEWHATCRSTAVTGSVEPQHPWGEHSCITTMALFATPSSYCNTTTPSRTPFSRIPERASTLFREVKRRSVRIKRSCSFQLKSTPGIYLIKFWWELIFQAKTILVIQQDREWSDLLNIDLYHIAYFCSTYFCATLLLLSHHRQK